MAAQRIVLSLALAIGSVGALQNVAFAQEYRGTWEQQIGLHARCVATVQ